MRPRKILCSTLLLLALCAGCGAQADTEVPAEPSERSFFAMNTYITMQASGTHAEDALEAAEELVLDLEGLLSVTEETSELYEINHSGGQPVAVDETTAELLTFALEMAEETGGALDPTIYPVLTAWGFTTENRQVPAQEKIDRLLPLVDYTQVQIADGMVTLPEGVSLDLGAVAKGYTGDRIARLLEEQGIFSALINLGGNVQAVGGRPDGTPWRIGVRDPFSEGNLGVLEVEDCAVVTSGGYQNYFTGEDGQVYWHILDPDTGYPARTGLASVTVVAPEGVRCDALSTALFVMGADDALDYWREAGGFDLILVTEEREVYITLRLENAFSLNGDGFTLEVVEP